MLECPDADYRGKGRRSAQQFRARASPSGAQEEKARGGDRLRVAALHPASDLAGDPPVAHLLGRADGEQHRHLRHHQPDHPVHHPPGLPGVQEHRQAPPGAAHEGAGGAAAHQAGAGLRHPVAGPHHAPLLRLRRLHHQQHPELVQQGGGALPERVDGGGPDLLQDFRRQFALLRQAP